MTTFSSNLSEMFDFEVLLGEITGDESYARVMKAAQNAIDPGSNDVVFIMDAVKSALDELRTESNVPTTLRDDDIDAALRLLYRSAESKDGHGRG